MSESFNLDTSDSLAEGTSSEFIIVQLVFQQQTCYFAYINKLGKWSELQCLVYATHKGWTVLDYDSVIYEKDSKHSGESVPC